MYSNLLLLAIFGGCVASQAKAGIWSNFITLVNVITAALLAVNYWEPLANWLQSNAASLTYLLDFISLWLIFGVSMGVMRAATDSLSQVKVKFKKPIDTGVGIFLACWIGWVVVCFTTMTLHTAPLSRTFLGFQETPQSRMLFGLAPDHTWLGFVQKESQGTLARNVRVRHPDGTLTAGNKFDPKGEFILKYGERRGRFERELGTTIGDTP
jgi:Colicin V production protein